MMDGSNSTGEFKETEMNLIGNPLKSNIKKVTHKDLLYHGTEIIKTYTKLKVIFQFYVKIGPNIFKANLLSKIIYILERKQYYKEMYILFGEKRK